MAPSPKQSMKQIMAIENRLTVVREYKNLWQEYFKFFADGFDEDKKISDQEEQAFFQIMSRLSQGQYRFAEMAGEYFKDGDNIISILSDSPSLETLKQMSDAQFSKFQVDWHTVFIAMNKAIGKLMILLPQPKK